MHGACILSFIVRTRDARTYHGACILSFTVYTHDAHTYIPWVPDFVVYRLYS